MKHRLALAPIVTEKVRKLIGGMIEANAMPVKPAMVVSVVSVIGRHISSMDATTRDRVLSVGSSAFRR